MINENSLYIIMRAASCFFATALLTQSGSLTQFVAQNGLASPSTLGIGSLPLLSLLLFSILKLIFFPDWAGQIQEWPLMLLLYLLFTPLFLRLFRHSFVKFPILLGLGINLSIIGLYQLIQFIFIAENRPFPYDLYMGSFKQVDSNRFLFITIIFIVGQFWLTNLQRRLRPLLLGKEFAEGLGVNTNNLKFEVYLFTFLMAGAITFPFGLLNFLDLTLPHLIRALFPWSRKLKTELFLGTFFMAAFVTTLDMLCYFFPWKGAEFSLGLVSSCFGPLILVYLVWRKIDEKKYAI
ncbi:MAG: iron chelate uptake ABC transporter family permease subunit [Bacteriovoracaceae bacterium]|nr:iron chelate uptake ABC transporter family permease subunit [Bacteriovoracaceae bacterium]